MDHCTNKDFIMPSIASSAFQYESVGLTSHSIIYLSILYRYLKQIRVRKPFIFILGNILVAVVVVLGYYWRFCYPLLILITMQLPYLIICIIWFSITDLDQFLSQFSPLSSCIYLFCFKIKINNWIVSDRHISGTILNEYE